MIWKDYQITLIWLKNQVKKDIKDIFISASSPDSYVNTISDAVRDYLKAIKSIFTTPTFGLYWATTLFIFSWILSSTLSWTLWTILSTTFFGFLVVFAYVHLKLKSGESLKDYKKKYFPETFPRRDSNKIKRFK